MAWNVSLEYEGIKVNITQLKKFFNIRLRSLSYYKDESTIINIFKKAFRDRYNGSTEEDFKKFLMKVENRTLYPQTQIALCELIQQLLLKDDTNLFFVRTLKSYPLISTELETFNLDFIDGLINELTPQY